MPTYPTDDFRPTWWCRNGHINTVYGGSLRTVPAITFQRERIDTPDGDFLDLDWLVRPGKAGLVILCHGLEGNSRRPYMTGMASRLHDAGWNVLSWNYRGCSGVPNRTLGTYHSGRTEDLRFVVDRYANKFDAIGLVGFSLGGNLVLKYLGEEKATTPVAQALVFSVPCDLAASSAFLGRLAARPYMHRFMRSLKRKVRQKAALFPEQIDTRGLDSMRTFAEFDNRYTAPLNGFRDAHDYWARASAKPLIPRITVQTLVVNALDDPFLPPACYPVKEVAGSASVTLAQPRHGGHVGFAASRGRIWSEGLAVKYFGGGI